MNNDKTKKSVLDIINRVYYNGLTTTSGGNISAMSDDGTIFITPSGIDKGTLSIKDIMEVRSDGTRIGPHTPSMELPFHSNIYKLRPDIKGVVHAHAPDVVAYAVARLAPTSKISPIFYRMLGTVVTSEYDIPGSLTLGDIVKEKFLQGYNTVMMDNHGATVGGHDLEDAYKKYEALNNCCNVLLNSAMLGSVHTIDAISNYDIVTKSANNELSNEDLIIAEQLSKILQRSFYQKLVPSYAGTFAYKQDDGSIIVNPDSISRSSINASDFVKYKNNTFNRDAKVYYIDIIEKIFDNNPKAKTVFISMPNATMAFAVSHHEFNSRLIPESYMMLKDIVPVAYNASASCISKSISVENPSIIINNECAITIGKNIIKSFDRMEVLDYSARSVIAAKQVADIVPINQKQVDDINRTFNGW